VTDFHTLLVGAIVAELRGLGDVEPVYDDAGVVTNQLRVTPVTLADGIYRHGHPPTYVVTVELAE
jgi:hypothetical protein